MSKKQKKKTIKKPNPFLYYLACIVIAPFLKLRLHTSYDRSGIRNALEDVDTQLTNASHLAIGSLRRDISAILRKRIASFWLAA